MQQPEGAGDAAAPEAARAGDAPAPDGAGPGEGGGQAGALDPQRLIRIASVTREVLEEARRIQPEASAVDHLRRVHAQICEELEQALPPELYKELDELTPEVRSGSLEELALAHAEILGWLEGLFQGTQLALQMQAARALQQQIGRGPAERPGLPPERDSSDPRYL